MDAITRQILSAFDDFKRNSLDVHTLFQLIGSCLPTEREAILHAVLELTNEGLLRRDRGGDFYQRTEDGRLAVAGPREITLYTREGCHLCEEAKSKVTPLLSEFGAALREVDIDDDPILHRRFTNDVPVIFLGSQLVAQHRLDPPALRRRLERAKA